MYSSSKTNTSIIVWLMMLCFWLAFVFLDGTFSHQQFTAPVSVPTSLVSAPVLQPQAQALTSSVQTLPALVTQTLHSNSAIFQDLKVLEYLYQKNKNPDLLQSLVEKFLQYYQFDKANQYLDLLAQQKGGYWSMSLDPKQVLYTRFNDSRIAIDNTNWLSDVFMLVDDYKSQAKLATDDILFYDWLKSLWGYDYSGASDSFSKITDTRYKNFKTSYAAALSDFVKIKNPPLYYRDGLVSLTLLKNGYFVLAKRLALHALLKDNTYVLPYQVLAYANFLTQNWEASAQYFLKLADFDTSNASLYKFLIGVSYYRQGDYEQSILYLSQITAPALQTDVYRYMLLWYIQGGDTTHMVRMWQNLLGQSDLQSSDFSNFFYQMYYLPYRIGKPFQLYFDTPQLATLYHDKCTTILTGDKSDVCLYGEVWLQLAKQNLSWIGDKLLSLAGKYHQATVFHIVGDYYTLTKQYALAKQYYAKALSICDNPTEQTILQNKLTK